MRLVCEQCSASYTIEDDLVGDRDFRVSCKQCGTPIVVKHERVGTEPPVGQQTTGTGSQPTGPLKARPPRPPASFAPTGHEEWFVWIAGEQRGPFRADQVAGLIERSEMDWGSQVWRDGFKDWRAARRDATLVTAVAGVSGSAGDTMRLNAARSFLAPEDTIVEARPDVLQQPSQRISIINAEHLVSTSDTQALDARDMSQLMEAVQAEAPPSLAPQPPPQQWNTPENAAFRAGLGLPPDTISVRRAGSSRPPVAQPSTVGDSFRSAPSLIRSAVRSDAATDGPHSDERDGWLPGPRSLLTVAALAFAGGVVAAAIASKVLIHPKPTAEKVRNDAPTAIAAPAPKPVETQAAAAPPAPQALTLQPIVAPVTRELPEQDELRREVRRVAPDVKRCILDPAAGVDVGVFIDGPSGRVRDVDVRSEGLTPGRVDCVIRAVRAMQIAPFSRPEVKLEHRFSW